MLDPTQRSGLHGFLWLLTLSAPALALPGCPEDKAEDQDACSAATPICDPTCATGTTCTFSGGTCGCQPLAPTCSAATPVCDPACTGDATCTFGGGSCICESPEPTCSAATPVCEPACTGDTTCTFDGGSCACEGPAPVCGNGSPEAGEECDDGNTVGGDGCDSSCQIEVESCSAATPVCDPLCTGADTCVFFETGGCSCVPPPPVCSEQAPVCDPACGGDEQCVYSDGDCACLTKCIEGAEVCDPACVSGEVCGAGCSCFEEPPSCNPEAPACAGGGPNNGCDAGFVCDATCACVADVPPPRLSRPSRSSAVDIDEGDLTIAMVNTDDGSVTFFDNSGATPTFRAKVATSLISAASEPMAVVMHPDGVTAFVANRRSGSVAKITAVDTATPTLALERAACAECVGVALSPSGETLVVSDWVNGEVKLVATSTLDVTRTVTVGVNPYAIAVTNDGDDDDGDEKVLVTEFFGRFEGKEMLDDARTGIVHVIPFDDGEAPRQIELAPLAACFTGDLKGTEATTGCYPNQLHGIAIHTAFGKTRAYVVSVAASPKGPVSFNHNMQALLSVIDVDGEAEESALAKNLNQLVKDQQLDTDGDDSKGRRFINVPSSIAFVDKDNVAFAYVTGAASDIVLRVAFNADDTVGVGSTTNFNIPVGENPQAIVTRHKRGADAFVANLLSRNLSVLSFADQVEATKVKSTDTPTAPAAGAEPSQAFREWKGKRFFNTGTGIWAKEAWGSCQGCHFVGLSDNVTWAFAAGPRQTLSLDGQYATNDGGDMRALNWTAIFDETHDFENNTRGVSGGKGAIQRADGTPVASPAGAPAPFAQVTVEDGTSVENHQALNGSMKFLTHTPAICGNAVTCPDWDFIDEYIKSIRSPNGATNGPGDADAGRTLFADGGCAKCHSGPKWTTSRTFFDPEVSTGTLPTRVFEVQRAFGTNKDAALLQTLADDVNQDATLVAGNDGAGTPALRRLACNLRDVDTFAAAGGAAETRENGSEAQGLKGFNPPSLLGLSLSWPYFHNGAAETLADVLDAARFEAHLTAGNPNFIPTAEEVEDLVAFLRSIDESTEPFDIATDVQLCPLDFSE